VTGTEKAPHYVAGAIEQALAEDPRTHELGIHADVRGDVVHLTGEVAGEERRRLIEDVARQAAPGLTIRNEVSVAELYPPGREETLG
jgi:osmotically-inducible protein OsmY